MFIKNKKLFSRMGIILIFITIATVNATAAVTAQTVTTTATSAPTRTTTTSTQQIISTTPGTPAANLSPTQPVPAKAPTPTPITTAAPPSPTPASQQPPQPVTNQPQAQYCPLASTLTQDDDKTWRSGKEWRGYEQTIVTEVQSFVGAQWTGVKIGKIICLYQGKQALDFPISLEQKFTPEKGGTLVKEPTTSNWSPQTQGYRFCKSTNVTDCPFFKLNNEQVDSGEKLYEQINYAPIRDNE